MMEIVRSAMTSSWMSTWYLARQTLLPQSDVDFHIIAMCDTPTTEKHPDLPLYRLTSSKA